MKHYACAVLVAATVFVSIIVCEGMLGRAGVSFAQALPTPQAVIDTDLISVVSETKAAVESLRQDVNASMGVLRGTVPGSNPAQVDDRNVWELREGLYAVARLGVGLLVIGTVLVCIQVASLVSKWRGG